MPRLKRVSSRSPGWSRKAHGSGFSTVARASYIDPRVIDAYESGSTIVEAASRRYRTPQARQSGIESAVLSLLGAG